MFIIAIINLVLILLLTSLSGWRKGPDEDDGFWEVYDSYRNTHILMTVFLIGIMCLSVPIQLEYTFVLLDTLKDKDFFHVELPKLDGCVDEESVKEVLALSKEKTFDQLIMLYLQVGLTGGSVVFVLLNLLTIMIRKCMVNCQQEREYQI